MKNFNGETWLRISILLCSLIISVTCLRGSELVLNASKAKQQSTPPTNTNATGGEITGADGSNKTTSEKSHLTGIPQIDYIHDPNLPRELNGYNLSNYPFYNAIPTETIDFKCDGLHDGFYASVPHYCQVYHHCLYGIRYDFLCANYTAFDQKTFICHFVSEVDCNNSPKYYQRNEALYKAATTAEPIVKTTTTKPTTEAPKKSDDDVKRPGPYRHRRPPYRRRPAYEYYDNGEDYYDDDYYYYGPPVRKRPNRNKGYRGDYYGGERAGGHKSIHRDSPRRKPLKPLYEEDDEEYEYYDDSADNSRDDDDRKRPLDNNYRKPIDRDRPYQNKKRDKDTRFSESGSRNDKKKRTEDDYNSRKSDDDKRLRNKYSNKNFPSRSKYDRDEDDLDDLDNPRYQDDKRDKIQKNKSWSESPKRVTDNKPFRSKISQKTTPSSLEDEEYDDEVVTPKWKSRFQINSRRSNKENSKKSGLSREEDDSSERKSNSKAEKPREVTESTVSVTPSIYARQPSKLYSQVKVETRPPQVQKNKDHNKNDVPATTMSSYRRPLNSRSGSKERTQNESERQKPVTKYTTPSSDFEEYEEEDSVLEDTSPEKAYYEEDVSETYLNEQFPSKSSPTTPKPFPSRGTYRDHTQPETTTKIFPRNKSTEQSSYNRRFKASTERQAPSPTPKLQNVETSTTSKPLVTENQFTLNQEEPVEESQTLPYLRQQAGERQTYNSERQPYNSERQTFNSERQPFNQDRAQFNAERQNFNSERQNFNGDRQTINAERQAVNPERQTFNSERQSYTERQPYTERQAYTERQPYTERQTYTERQQFNYNKQPVTERQPQISYQRQPYVERQPYTDRQQVYVKQPSTERLIPFQKQQITTERQVIPYVKLPVTDRQIIPYKQIVTERQIIPYLRQSESERKAVPFPKQPPRTFEITAPGPSGLGGRIEVSDSVPRGKYVIQGDRPSGFSLRLQQSEYTNPLQPSTQIQRRPEESNQEKLVSRTSFKPVRNYRSKPTSEPQYHDSLRLDSYPQRYLTGTEEYEPVVIPNPRIPVIPQIAHVTNSKEWYW